MRIIFLIFLSNFKRALNDKRKFITNLLVPVIAIILAMFVNYVGEASINIAVVKNVNFPEENRIISQLKSTKGINTKVVSKDLVRTETILGKYDGVITFKKTFNKNEKVSLNKYFDFYNVKDAKTNDMMKNLIRLYLVSDKSLNVKDEIQKLQSGTLSKTEQIIAFLATVLLITTVVNAAVMIKDREENTLARFMYSPNHKFKYVLGNVLYNYVFSYVQLFIAIAITHLLGMKLGISFVTLISYGLLLTLMMTTFGTFIACLFKKELYANLFAAAISLVLSLIGGTFIIYDKMPRGLQILSTVTPNRWIIKSVQYMEHGTISGLNPMMILLMFSIIFALAATVMNVVSKVEVK